MPVLQDTLALEHRDMTRLRVLEAIRNAGRIARTDIAARVDTSPATVTAITAEMLAADLIEEVPADPAGARGKRGRPRVLLKLNPAARIVAGVKVGRHTASVLLADFEGKELVSRSAPLSGPTMTPAALVADLSRAVSGACDRLGLRLSDLAGLSVGLAGLIDSRRNFVHWSSSLTGRNHDLGPLLARAFPCPAFIENDANMVAKAEQLFGDGRGLSDVLVVTIEHGLGLGVILDGRLHRGARGVGAEFGHTRIALDGAPCQCGGHGCLEAYVGDYALLRAAAAVASPAPATVEEITRRAAGGDAALRAVLDRAGQIFALGLVNLINLFDPERIVLAGAQVRFDHLHSEAVMARVRTGVMQVDAPLPEIRVHHWGDAMWARGAAAHALEQVTIRSVSAPALHAS